MRPAGFPTLEASSQKSHFTRRFVLDAGAIPDSFLLDCEAGSARFVLGGGSGGLCWKRALRGRWRVRPLVMGKGCFLLGESQGRAAASSLDQKPGLARR